MDRTDTHHQDLKTLYDASASERLLPCDLPEVDDLLLTQIGQDAQEACLEDLADGRYAVEWAHDTDLDAAHQIGWRYQSSKLGLVDATVIAIAQRLRARAIATLDLRHFGAARISGHPMLMPRDLGKEKTK